MSGNTDIFNAVEDAARAFKETRGMRAVRSKFGKRQAEVITLDMLQGHLAQAAADAGGTAWEIKDLSTRRAKKWFTVGKGLISTPQGLKRGQGAWPAPEKRRPYGTARMRQEKRTYTIPFLIDCNAAKSMEGRGPGKRLSVTQVHELAKANGSMMSRKAVQTEVARLEGTPVRDAKIASLPRPAQDLIKVLTKELPGGRLSLVDTDSVLEKLWRCPRRKGMMKLRDLIEPINTARVGITLMLHDDGLVVGRGCRIPYLVNPYLLKDITPGGELKLLRLSPGQLSSRRGLWGSDEGQLAQDVVEHVEQRDERIYLYGIATIAGSHTVHEYDGLCRKADYLHKLSTQAGISKRQRVEMAERARQFTAGLKAEVKAGIAALAALENAECEGLGAVWRAAASMWYLRRRAEADPAAARRIDRIGKLLDLCRDQGDLTSLIEHMAERKAGRGEWVAPSEGRPVRYRHPKPMPKFRSLYMEGRALHEKRLAAWEEKYTGIPEFLRPALYPVRKPLPPFPRLDHLFG